MPSCANDKDYKNKRELSLSLSALRSIPVARPGFEPGLFSSKGRRVASYTIGQSKIAFLPKRSPLGKNWSAKIKFLYLKQSNLWYKGYIIS